MMPSADPASQKREPARRLSAISIVLLAGISTVLVGLAVLSRFFLPGASFWFDLVALAASIGMIMIGLVSWRTARRRL
ncbi:MAG: hypothetical protein IMW89_10020 [Ktedonobacteraceae bacterium]|nr:hypothetical protein [Ktedonobacteraceae bacterium]